MYFCRDAAVVLMLAEIQHHAQKWQSCKALTSAAAPRAKACKIQ